METKREEWLSKLQAKDKVVIVRSYITTDQFSLGTVKSVSRTKIYVSLGDDHTGFFFDRKTGIRQNGKDEEWIQPYKEF
jgi:hypothetical protein